MNRVFREEKKFLINVEEFIKKSHQLEQVLIQDEHNGTNGYMIRSLYFDTVYDDDYFEKQALRCYDPDSNYAMLEMKQKQGSSQLKRSLRMTREDAMRMIQGYYYSRVFPKEFTMEYYQKYMADLE